MERNTKRPRSDWEIAARKKMVELNLTNAALAKAINRQPSYVSRTLNGGYNLTLGKTITRYLDLDIPYPGSE